MKAQSEFATHWKLHNTSLTNEALNAESITIEPHQTIEQRDEQERESDLIKLTLTRVNSGSNKIEV